MQPPAPHQPSRDSVTGLLGVVFISTTCAVTLLAYIMPLYLGLSLLDSLPGLDLDLAEIAS